jgi:hypothetical protein
LVQIQASIDAYKEALSIAYMELDSNNIIRLGTVINFADFYYRLGNEKTKACLLLKSAFDDSVAEFIPSNDQNDDKNVILMLNIIKNNLIHWCSSN